MNQEEVSEQFNQFQRHFEHLQEKLDRHHNLLCDIHLDSITLQLDLIKLSLDADKFKNTIPASQPPSENLHQ